MSTTVTEAQSQQEESLALASSTAQQPQIQFGLMWQFPEIRAYQETLTPRRPFDTFCEAAEASALPWGAADALMAFQVQQFGVGTCHLSI